MTKPEIKAVLFDLGGVLVELGGLEHWKALSGKQNDAEIWYDWLHCPVVKAYETGQSSTQTFGQGIVERHQLEIEPEDFIGLFATWPKGLFPGASDVVRDVHEDLVVGCFSNTNEMHWESQIDWNHIQNLFAVHFLSFRMGWAKPDPRAFDHVIEVLEMEPSEIFFIDDNQINVDAARERGIQAHVAKGPDATRRLLKEQGLAR